MKNHLSISIMLTGLLIMVFCQPRRNDPQKGPGKFTLYSDSVVQHPYVARALSPTEMVSGYRSRANTFRSPRISFKFSINGKDNEMVSGRDHHFTCLEGTCQPPLIRFGEQLADSTAIPPDTYLKPNTTLHLRLDMRDVLAAFKSNGYYTAFNGDEIYQEDFKGVFVAGNTAPMIWDFDNLAGHPELALKDPDADGIYEVTLRLNEHIEEKQTAARWTLSTDLSAFPRYTSGRLLVDALYNMAMEEMVMDVEADSTFRTGKEWAGVWTRDISYSIILSMAALQPQVSRYSLMRKVKDGRIVQDTGTGGAYPVSTDRIIWAMAAWELYTVTGDRAWLKKAYGIVSRSLEDDLKHAYDEKTGLFRGESSFLDWREQTYPEWMQPADIYASACLGTNAVFYQANIVLARMAEQLKDRQAAEKYRRIAEAVKKGINTYLWLPEKGYYGQYRYGRNFSLLSPRSEALGEALCVLFGVAGPGRQQSIVARTPVTTFGIPCIYPQIPGIPPYHNNGIWPFVQAYWSMAAAKAGNETALTESLNAIYRPAALFLTNKENFVAATGDYAGTQINSDRMLWSLSGNLAMVYKVFFGMDFQADRLAFHPFVPQAFQGNHRLANFRYREAVLDIELDGYGNKVQSFILDGKKQEKAEIPAGLKGAHTIKIILAGNTVADPGINKLANHFSPATPAVSYRDSRLRWQAQEGVSQYKVYKNGQKVAATIETSCQVSAGEYAEFQVIAVDTAGYPSFASEPVVVGTENSRKIYELEELLPEAPYPYKGYSGKGFVATSKSLNTRIRLEIEVPAAGVYAIDFRYANGNGPVNTDNKCAIRTLRKEGAFLGTVVLPQRGPAEWSDWGYTNPVQVKLLPGTHTFSLSLESFNNNMNGEINQAMLDHMRVTRIE